VIKKIKVKKQLRLDELIKYVFDNELNPIVCFKDGGGRASVIFGGAGSIEFGEYSYGTFHKDDTFTVEVEEEITEDTVFRELVISDGQKTSIAWNCSIRDCEHPSNQKFYTHVGGILELIWSVKEVR